MLGKKGNAKKAKVKITHQLGSDNEIKYTGELVRLLSDVDSAGRMARVLIAVHKPLDAQEGKLPLLLGSYVRIELEGKEVDNVFRMPQESLREDDKVWIANGDNKLKVKQVIPIFTKDKDVYVTGLKEGDLVINSPVQNALEGILVKIKSD